MTINYEQEREVKPVIRLRNVDEKFYYWLEKARERMFSLASGDRVATIAPRIMEVGLGKILYAANDLGIDPDGTKTFCIFAPDGTVSYNPVRTERGFSYGAMLHYDLEGLLVSNNSMPNGCGFSLYEIEDPPDDSQLLNYLTDAQFRLGQDQLSQLGKGNHFAGLYYVLDPLSGEDTHRRFVVIHCSGHTGGNKLYHADSWLRDMSGYHEIGTPHGVITVLEEEAKNSYLAQFQETNEANAKNRDLTMDEIFSETYDWRKLEAITHQGISADGINHFIGTQVHDGLIPVAFNPDEGLIAVKTKKNLSSNFLDHWEAAERVRVLNLEQKFRGLNFTPHGGGYEFKIPFDRIDIRLNHEGIDSFLIHLIGHQDEISFNYFREIREWMTYRRKSPIIQQMSKADLASIIYEMPCLMQIYPLVSIPGGSH